MRETSLEQTLAEHIDNTPVGEKVTISFKGEPNIIEVEMNFSGGWVITQTIIPGQSLEFVRGDNQYLNAINITFKPYEGLK
jgi:hypothetical protein